MAEALVKTASDKGRPAEIMLVEDNPGDVVLTKKAFAALKFANNLTVASDGEEALAMLRDEGATLPDLILLDINMPLKGGIFMLEELKKNPRLAKIAVVMLTSSGAPTDIMASYNLEASSYIIKPLTMDKLGTAMAKLENFWTVLYVNDATQ